MTRVRIIDEYVVAGHRLGRHVEHDPESLNFLVQELAASSIKAVAHTRRGGPFNQGQLGSCTGNAMAGALNTIPIATSESRLMTEKDAVSIYEAATIIDGIAGQYPPTDTGSSGLAVCKVAKQRGLISGYKHALTVNGALSALQANPVITGVNWYEGFDTPDATGLVKISGQVRGGHEFEILEFTPATTGDAILDGIVTAENSWGPDWGVDGRFHFTARTWATLLEQDGDVTVPLPKAAA